IARRGRLELEEHHQERAREVLEEIAREQSVPGMGRGGLRKDLMAAWEAAGIRTDRGRGDHLLAERITCGSAAYGPGRDGGAAGGGAGPGGPRGRRPASAPAGGAGTTCWSR